METAKCITFTLGDISGDGHGKTDTFIAFSNLSSDELRERYEAVVNKTGIDIRDICCDYEDDVITEEVKKKLEKIGIDLNLRQFVLTFATSDDIFNILIQFINLGLKPGEFLRSGNYEEFCGSFGPEEYMYQGEPHIRMTKFFQFGYGTFGE